MAVCYANKLLGSSDCLMSLSTLDISSGNDLSLLLVTCPSQSYHLNQCWNSLDWIVKNKLKVELKSKYSHFHSRKYAWKCCLQNLNIHHQGSNPINGCDYPIELKYWWFIDSYRLLVLNVKNLPHWYSPCLVIDALALITHNCYLNLLWLIVYSTQRNKIHWNSNQNMIIVVKENAFENEVLAAKCRPSCPCLDLLISPVDFLHSIFMSDEPVS